MWGDVINVVYTTESSKPTGRLSPIAKWHALMASNVLTQLYPTHSLRHLYYIALRSLVARTPTPLQLHMITNKYLLIYLNLVDRLKSVFNI